jgi:hypothetical protein
VPQTDAIDQSPVKSGLGQGLARLTRFFYILYILNILSILSKKMKFLYNELSRLPESTFISEQTCHWHAQEQTAGS